jgi:hypothetical protein
MEITRIRKVQRNQENSIHIKPRGEENRMELSQNLDIVKPQKYCMEEKARIREEIIR